MWAFWAMIGGALMAVAALVRGALAWAVFWGVVTVAADRAARIWSRSDPGPMPYWMRWILLAPRPFQSSRRLTRILDPQRGERMLEIGPGIGVHALPVAAALGPGGTLSVLDVQQEMLDDLMRRATAAGIRNIVATRGDARTLPFPDRTFDGAYLFSVLGEIPDQDVALQELRRVLRPNGRLIVGEFFIDPDFITSAELQPRICRAGFAFDRKIGPSLAYLARFNAT
jgi:SAM-dependent methyltransferase